MWREARRAGRVRSAAPHPPLPVLLMRRETCGSFSGKSHCTSKKIFEKIPPRLRFSLLDIVPSNYLHDHVFMGFTQCGQFLLSFTCHTNASFHVPPTVPTGSFREGHHFRLHFLSWVPGQKANLVHSVPIFDDDMVDNRVTVSIAQWKHNPSLLVVYGIAEFSTEHSYLSVVGVPQLGCRKCAALSNCSEVLDFAEERCIQHNFAIHTKFYCAAESAMCEPVVQLAYHNQIVIYTDFIHILEIDLITPDQDEVNHEEKNVHDSVQTNLSLSIEKMIPSNSVGTSASADIIVQSILADFSDMEVELPLNVKPIQVPDVLRHEVYFHGSQSSPGCSEVYVGIEDNWDSVPSPRTLISPPLRSPSRRSTESISRFNEMDRIADKTYEFVEETEPKCEKLSLFRKRRLADKKYEFSEDNSENIVPFRVLRSRKYFIGNTNKVSTRRARSPSEGIILRVHNQITQSMPILNPDIKYNPVIAHFHNREVVNDVEYRITAMQEDGSLKTIALHDSSSKTLSDYIVEPQDPYLVHSGNSKCSKQFTRRFVESDDDITSIITDSEDDCLSGYHIALPLVAHGAGYAPLQPVSMSAWEKMKIETPVLQASQRSLDIELLCNEVCLRLCRLNKKKFIYCFDWGCHVIGVCQSSGCICGVCAMWLWASDGDTTDTSSTLLCHLCKESNYSCIVHRKQYAAECLFVWDLVSGLYRTEHASFKEDSTHDTSTESGCIRARQMALQLAPIPSSHARDIRLLTTLTTGRSLKRLTDLDHCIEIIKEQHPDASETESSASEDSDFE